MSARNITHPLAAFDEPIPDNLAAVDGFVDRFMTWQIGRLKKPEALDLWGDRDSYADVTKYIRRKVWALKIEAGSVINPVAKMIAATVYLHRKYRADVHEALNHAAKHNTEISKLGQELRDQLDDVVRSRLEETTQMLAGAALATVPQLQQVLMLEKQA
ncbi:hypothetical protein [uncultured Thiodictyon sp.]|uniref:hypothetical protein n=1 Tax=uncultured Thiodictyon sp. TaxID=1846217 RepID=UPI0025D69C04|nr:hypothetical protein [uncultured Thiodictyon sp.]